MIRCCILNALAKPTPASGQRVAVADGLVGQIDNLGPAAAFFSERNSMSGTERNKIKSGSEVQIVQKQDQRSGLLTRGVVKDILTKSPTHPHGIKVRLETGEVGRVKEILSEK